MAAHGQVLFSAGMPQRRSPWPELRSSTLAGARVVSRPLLAPPHALGRTKGAPAAGSGWEGAPETPLAAALGRRASPRLELERSCCPARPLPAVPRKQNDWHRLITFIRRLRRV